VAQSLSQTGFATK